jgi:hypothetical protein
MMSCVSWCSSFLCSVFAAMCISWMISWLRVFWWPVCIDCCDCSETRAGDSEKVYSLSQPPVVIDRGRDKFFGVDPSDEDQLYASHTNIIRVSACECVRARAVRICAIAIIAESEPFHSIFQKPCVIIIHSPVYRQIFVPILSIRIS